MNIFNIGASKIFVNSFISGLKKRFLTDLANKDKITIFFQNKLHASIFKNKIRLLNELELETKIENIYSLDFICFNDFSNYNLVNKNENYDPLSIFEQEALFKNLVLKYCKINDFAQNLAVAREIIFLMNELNKNDSSNRFLESSNLVKYEKNFIDVFKKIIDEYQTTLKKINKSDPVQYLINLFENIASYLIYNPPNKPIIFVISNVSNLNHLKITAKLSSVSNCYVILHTLDTNLDSLELKNTEKTHYQHGWQDFFKNINFKPENVLEWDKEAYIPNIFINEVFRSSSTIDKWCSGVINYNQYKTIKVLEFEDLYNEAKNIGLYIKTYLKDVKNIFLVTEDITLINYLKIFLEQNNLEYVDFYNKGYKRNQKFIEFMLLVEVLSEDKKLSKILSLFTLKRIQEKIFTSSNSNLVNKIISFLNKFQGIAFEALEINNLKNTNLEFGNEEFLNFVCCLKKINEINNLNTKCKFNYYFEKHIEIYDHLLSNNHDEIFIEDLEGKELLEFLDIIKNGSENIEVNSFAEYVRYLEVAVGSYSNKICIDNLSRVNFIDPQDIANFCGETIIIPSFNSNFWPNQNKYVNNLVSQQFKNYSNLINEYKYAGFVAHDLYKVLSCSNVLITRSLYCGDDHTTASRWLTRIKIVAEKYNIISEIYSYNNIKLLNLKVNSKGEKIAPPIAFPELRLRPQKISASRIEMLIKNPYAFYASEILKLKNNFCLYLNEENKNYGSFVHYVLDFYTKNNFNIENFTYKNFKQLLHSFLDNSNSNNEKKILWYLKIVNILKWFSVYNKHQIENNLVYSEVKGELFINLTNGINYKLYARADRITANMSANYIEITDYKTGTLPKKIDIANLSEGIQLLVEAVIAKNNGFAISFIDNPQIKITYIELKGNALSPKLKEIDFSENNSIIDDVQTKIIEILTYYSDSLNGYNALTSYSDYRTDFDQFMRKKEWSS